MLGFISFCFIFGDIWPELAGLAGVVGGPPTRPKSKKKIKSRRALESN